MSSSLLLQQCPACLVRRTCIVFVMGGKCPYSWSLVGCCRQDLFNTALKARKNNPKILKEYSPLLHSGKIQHKELPNAIIKDVISSIIIKGKSYTFKNPETKFRIDKNIVYIIEYNKCKEIYTGSIKALNTRISLHRSNIKIPENRKLNVSKHLYECSQGKFKVMPIYLTNNYTLLQIKEKTS